MKPLKFIIVFLGTLTVITGINYGIQDRFDIVCCCLITIQMLAAIMIQVVVFNRYGYPKKQDPGPPYDPEHLTESYDEGFQDAISRYLNYQCLCFGNSEYSRNIIKDLVWSANNMPQIKRLGKFVLMDDRPDKALYIKFESRYTTE